MQVVFCLLLVVTIRQTLLPKFEEAFEKQYERNGEILATVFAVVGPNAEEAVALFREWMNNKGFKRTSG